NYTSIFTPTLSPLAIPGASATDTAFITDSYAVMNDYLTALVSDERYQGAGLGGDATSQTNQLAAFNAAMDQAAIDLPKLGADITAFSNELIAQNISDQDLSANSL